MFTPELYKQPKMSEEELRRLTNWQNSGMSRAVFEKE
jgi:hypothetical protein